MKLVIISDAHQQFIKDNFLKISSKKMAKELPFSREVVKRFMRENNLIVPKEVSKQFRADANKRPFLEIENLYIKENIRTKNIKQIAKEMGRSSITIQKQLHRLGLTEIIEQKKKDSYYKKGHISHNKDKKQNEYMSDEGIERSMNSRFQKGRLPHNTNVLGTEKIRCNHNKKYVMVKTHLGMEYRHITIWEGYNGLVPKGYNIVHIDGNTMNDAIENLECISNAELMERNTIHRYPTELKPTIKLINKIKRKSKENAKSKNI